MSTAIVLNEYELATIEGGDWISTTLRAVGGALLAAGQVNMQTGSFTVTQTFGASGSGPNVGVSISYNGTWLIGAYQSVVGGGLLLVGEAYEFIEQVVA
jgi:hypothetical protein